MKKCIIGIITFLMLLSLVGCGNTYETVGAVTGTMTDAALDVAETTTEAVAEAAGQIADAIAETETESNDEWKTFLAEYEAWADEYIAFFKKYKENPTDMSLLTEYSSMTAKLAEWTEKSNAMQLALEASPEALQEYTETVLRITKKIAETAY